MDDSMAAMRFPPGWLDTVVVAWFVLVALSVTFVARNSFTRHTEPRVMKWAWTLVTLYTGPLGAAFYLLSCAEPSSGTRETFVQARWKQAMGSTVHCAAGDGAGILVAAVVTHSLRLPMWADALAEYVSGFAFGLLVFQALSMRDMLGGSYGAAVRRSFLPELISMNAMMAGMVPVMVILMSRDTSAMHATSTHFWAIMSLAMTTGFVIAYPFNGWLVAAGLKHGMCAEAGMGGMHGGAPAAPTTGRQVAAVVLLSVLTLAAGLLMTALAGNLGMSPMRLHGSLLHDGVAPSQAAHGPSVHDDPATEHVRRSAYEGAVRGGGRSVARISPSPPR